MLSRDDNELLTRVGPGTPMGAMLRQYWMPFMRSDDLSLTDGPPQRVRLLGEDLVVFRDSQRRVGLAAENCPHRGASLFFGRNEEEGLRCVYHGWKFDTSGACVDMPNEPPESNFKHKVKASAYPCEDRGGMLWAYLGPRSTPPPLPELEWIAVEPEQRNLTPHLRECNWVQALEGDIDTTHLYFLHSRLASDGAPQDGVFHPSRRGTLHVVPTDYGLMYGARREHGESEVYWRITQFMFPIYTLFPPGGVGMVIGVPGHIWVPLDDEHTLVWSLIWNPTEPLEPFRANDFTSNPGGDIGEYLPNSNHPLGRWRGKGNRSNDYLLDRAAQRSRSFTGIPNFVLQDAAVTETMGAITNRSREHLGTSDAMIIQVRRRLLQAVTALREKDVTPPGVDDPSVYRVRSASVLLDRDADWIAATRPDVSAFTGRPVAYGMR